MRLFERAASTSLAPRFAAMRAVASPMPEDAPVMTMTCSVTRFSLIDMGPLPHCVTAVTVWIETQVQARKSGAYGVDEPERPPSA